MNINRRASITSPLFNYNHASRAHRSTESAVIHPPTATPSAQASTMSPPYNNAGNGPYDKVVHALIFRLRSRLPCHSGITLQALESDRAVLQTAETLIQIARVRLDLVVHSLNDLLEKITKAFPMDADGTLALEVLHSQLYVLKLLSAAMSFRWQCHREEKAIGRENGTIDPNSPTSPTPHQTRASLRNGKLAKESEWMEPPRLEEAIAKYALSVMTLFLRQTASASDRPKTSGHMHSVSFPDFNPPELASPFPPPIRQKASMSTSRSWGSRHSSQSLRVNGQLRKPGSINSSHSHPNFVQAILKHKLQASAKPMNGDGEHETDEAASQYVQTVDFADLPSQSLLPHTPAAIMQSASSINWLISKYAGKIIFYLSASNWHVVFAKIRNKIHHLAQSNEDSPDMVDMKLVSCSALDRAKLVQVMQELSSLLVNMKRESQGGVSIALRAALWNWVEFFPHEYLEVFRGTKPLEGAPERVFDLLFQMTESASKRAFWPTLTILLAASPEKLKASALGMNKSKKQNNFFDTLVKSLNSASKTAEIAIVCLIDLCKAAAYLPRELEASSLGTLAPEMADDLRNRIFNPAAPMKPFYETTEMIDVDLYADALVAIFRFGHKVALETVFPACIAPERSDAIKLCALKACLTLVNDIQKLPCQPPIASLFPLISTRTRMLVRSIMNRKHEVPGGSLRRPIAKRYDAQGFGDREQLLLTIFLLWRAEPGFVFCGVMADDAEYASLIGDGIKLFTQPADRTLRMALARTNLDLTRLAVAVEEGQEWYSESRTHLFCSGPMLTCAASIQLLESRETHEDDRNSLNIILQLFDITLSILSRYRLEGIPMPPALQVLSDIQQSAITLVELALIVTLTSGQLDITMNAAKCLGKLCELEEFGVNVGKYLKPEQVATRKVVLTELGDNRVMVTGRNALQRRMRRIMSTMSFPSVLNVAVWEECYHKWVILTESVMKAASDEQQDPSQRKSAEKGVAAEDRLVEWQYITLFLASFGACCVAEDSNLPSLTSVIKADSLPQRFQRPQRSPNASAKLFISQAVDLLVADSVTARETVKEAIGTELHPLLFPALFARIDTVVTSIFDESTPPWEEHIIIFIEQCISVIKLIFDRLHDVSETAHINVDIGRLVQYLARYIHRSATGSSGIRIKTKFAGLLDGMFLKRDVLPLRKEVTLRNSLLDIVVEWAFDSAAHDVSYAERESQQKLQAELDVACLRTAVQLLDRLQLQPVDGTTRSESVHVQSRLFYRYFSLFTKALAKWKMGEGDANDNDSIVSENVRARGNPKEQHALRDLIISGVTNLLSANMEAGLKHCIPMGYSDDPRTRRIFVTIFTRVLQLGTNFVALDSLEDADRFSRLCEMVRAPDMLLALAICDTCPQSDTDDMIGVLMNIFDTRTSLVGLLKAIIDREVAATTDEASLFRSNTMCTRLLSAFAKIHGYNYLRTLLSPLIHQMSLMPSGHSYELDPSRLRPGEDSEENQRHLQFICQAFLHVICDSVSVLPTIFREVCQHIAVAVSAIWPEAKYAAVGGFVFLRFICPAIVSPATVDIELPPDNPSIQRGLVLITKVIQNLANNILFGKEQHMIMLNSFLSSNIMPVTRFLSDILKYPGGGADSDQVEFLGVQYDETDHLLLHRFFHANADKIGKELLSYPGPPAARDTDFGTSGGKQTWDVLCATLVEVGAPTEVPKAPTLPAIQHVRFQEFLQRNIHRNTDSVRDIFLESPTPKERTPLFILSMHKLNVETVDLELLASYIFKTLNDPDNRPFDVIIDCTSFSSASEIPIQWLKFFVDLTPSDLVQRWTNAYFLNPNAHAQKFLRKLYHFFTGLYGAKSVIAYSSVAELLPVMHSMSVSSMSYPLSLEREPKETFAQVNKLDRHRMSHPVTMQVGTSHVRITSMKPKQIWGYATCKLTEIVLHPDIDDVYNVATGQDVNSFVIRHNRDGGTMYFAAAARETIIKSIRSAKGKLKADGASLVERPVQLGNLSATLLNLGLLNIGNEDESLRGAAFDMLRSVCKHLQCDDPLMLPVQGAFIPANPAAFVIQFSERMAKFAPQLTLDLMVEFFVGFDKSTSPQRAVCLQYISPWIPNLSGFRNPAVSYYEASAVKVREVIRSMIDITFNHHEVYPMIQRAIWAEMSKLDNRVLQITLDELFRAAIDGGISSRRCESIADTLVILGSINVRGKVLAKLRRVLGKTTMKPSKTLVDSPAWNEVAALTRLTLVVLYNNRVPVQTQLYVPEILHLVTMLAATGPVIMRVAVHGIVTNLLQSLCIARTEDDAGREKLQKLLSECSSSETLRLFGLAREDSSTEYVSLELATEQQAVDHLEMITSFLLNVAEAGAQTIGLGNVWRARWVGLVTSTAFQLSAYIQSRAFVVLGTIASSDVDDDLLYQILVAFRTALVTSSENDTTSVVSMLRCMRKLVPGLPENSRYLPHILWLPIALIQSSYVSLFSESARLLQATLTTLEKHGAFINEDLATVLSGARIPLDEISSQLDSVLGLSFECNFSFALATSIFKGIRHYPTREAATDLLHMLLRLSVRQAPQSLMEQRTVQHDSLGYFLALLPLATTNTQYRQLLEEAGAVGAWLGDMHCEEEDSDEGRPRILFEVLGVGDNTTALLAISFVVAMLNSAHSEKEQDLILFLLASAADTFPEMISLTYDAISEKINDFFANSNKASILESAAAIFRLASMDASWPGAPNASSTSIDPSDHHPSTAGGTHVFALNQIGMPGLANNHQFLPASRSLPLIKWIHELVSKIIE